MRIYIYPAQTTLRQCSQIDNGCSQIDKDEGRARENEEEREGEAGEE